VWLEQPSAILCAAWIKKTLCIGFGYKLSTLSIHSPPPPSSTHTHTHNIVHCLSPWKLSHLWPDTRWGHSAALCSM